VWPLQGFRIRKSDRTIRSQNNAILLVWDRRLELLLCFRWPCGSKNEFSLEAPQEFIWNNHCVIVRIGKRSSRSHHPRHDNNKREQHFLFHRNPPKIYKKNMNRLRSSSYPHFLFDYNKIKSNINSKGWKKPRGPHIPRPGVFSLL